MIPSPPCTVVSPTALCAHCGGPRIQGPRGPRCPRCERIRKREYKSRLRERFRAERQGPSGRQTAQTRDRFSELFRYHAPQVFERLAELLHRQQR